MSRYAILVEFDPLPEQRADFLNRLREDARETLGDDGCLRMEILLACDGSDRVVLSELWRDQAAVEAHRAKPGHSHAWQAPLLRSKRVIACYLD
jgi:quinol monooxygenase YgiN